MKKILLLILVPLFFFTSVQSQTVHAFIYVNTTDKTIGKSATRNKEIVTDFLKSVAAKTGFLLDLKIMEAKDFNYENMHKHINECKVPKGDMVFFYINTHGYKKSDSNKFPRLVIESTNPLEKKYLVSSSEINDVLVKNNPGAGSVITIIQACNRLTNSSADLPIEQGFLDNSTQNLLLLFKARVNVMVTSSQRGKTSIANSVKGSQYTRSFIQAVENSTKSAQPGSLSWEEVLQLSKKYALQLNAKRYPVWDIKNL